MTPFELQQLGMNCAQLFRQISGDIGGLGAHLNSNCDKAKGIVKRLSGVQVLLAEVREDLLEFREHHIAAEKMKLGINDDDRGLKLHIGSGDKRMDGWVNIDYFPAEFSMDVNWGLPFRDKTAKLIFCSHMLEHLYFPTEALMFLKEVRRVLESCGTLRIIVPDIEKCIRAYASGNDGFFEERKKTWDWASHCRTHLMHFLAYAGAGAQIGEFTGHKYGYDFATLELLLKDAGFQTIHHSHYMKSENQELLIDDQSYVAAAASGGSYYSLFVEAS